MTKRIPLRYSILSALLLLGALLTAVAHYQTLTAAHLLIETELQRQAESQGSRTASHLERDYKRGDPAEALDKLRLLGFEPHLVRAVLFDESGASIASSRFELRHTLEPFATRLLEQVRASQVGEVRLTPERDRLMGAFPLHLELTPGELRTARVGVVYLEYDLRAGKSVVHVAVLNRTLLMGAIVLAVMLATWLLLGLRLTRRIERLTDAFSDAARGNLAVEAPAEVQDELGEVGAAFNKMIAELRTKRDELAQSESRYRTLVDASPDAILVSDRERIHFVNPAAVRLVGASSAEEIYAREPLSFFPEELKPVIAERRGRMFSGQSVEPLEGRLLRMDGSTVEVSILVASYEQDGERLIQIIARDITAQEQHHAALQRSEARVADIVASAMDAIISVDATQRITLFNRAAERVFGWRAAEVIGRELDLLIPERYRNAHREHVQRFGETAATTRNMGGLTPLCGLRADGHEFPIEASISQSCAGGEQTFTVIVRDLSERVRAAEVQAQLERQLRHSQRMQSMGTLAGGIAHDFNNILLAISGNVRLALEDCPREHSLRASLVEIDRASRRASDLVRRMLAFSRANETKREPMQLQPVATEALRLLRAATPAMIEIRTLFAAGLPNVVADAGQMHQVVMNLATNAVQAMGDGPGILEVRLEAMDVAEQNGHLGADMRPGAYVRLTLADTGCGMDSATIDRMFDPFFTTKGPGQGTGLGLAIVHGIVTAHGGSIRVESERGRGTRIAIYLPATTVGLAKEHAAPEAPSAGRRERILYLDDEEPLVFLATRTLQRLNYRVTGFTDPVLAVATFREQPHDFDVFVSDLAMPQMSGFDVARAVLAIRPDIPILMMSGYVRQQDTELADRIGVRAVILKPDSIDELARRLQELFGQNLARQVVG